MIYHYAYRRWTKQEEEILRDMFITGREHNQSHKQLWETIAKTLQRKPSEVQRKLIRMYRNDELLQSFKRLKWSRENVLARLKELYLAGHNMNKSSLPTQLCFTILKVCPPSAPKHREWFKSLDHAIAEAILSVGYRRDLSNTIDTTDPINSLEEALEYVKFGHKKRHTWSLDEIRSILDLLHKCDFPLTLPFLSNHYDLYGHVLGLNRKLESFKDVIKKFIEDGSIKSYPELVCTIAPEYIAYYNQDKTRLKLSTEEIRVKKFLDRYRIPYIIPKLGDKLPTQSKDFPNVVPDFVLTSNELPIAIVEVFGSIGDRENSGVNEMYANKIKAKQQFYNNLKDIKFIEIHNNNDKCDLSDQRLFELLGSFIKY